jgi:hypothetical protein
VNKTHLTVFKGVIIHCGPLGSPDLISPPPKTAHGDKPYVPFSWGRERSNKKLKVSPPRPLYLHSYKVTFFIAWFQHLMVYVWGGEGGKVVAHNSERARKVVRCVFFFFFGAEEGASIKVRVFCTILRSLNIGCVKETPRLGLLKLAISSSGGLFRNVPPPPPPTPEGFGCQASASVDACSALKLAALAPARPGPR